MWSNGLRKAMGILVLSAGAGMAAAESIDLTVDEAIGAGIVESVDIAARMLIIGGYRYRFDPAVPVQIRGVPGTVGQLSPGMRMQFRYARAPDPVRQLLELREIPPGVVIESH